MCCNFFLFSCFFHAAFFCMIKNKTFKTNQTKIQISPILVITRHMTIYNHIEIEMQLLPIATPHNIPYNLTNEKNIYI